jgi:hypothetical protein
MEAPMETVVEFVRFLVRLVWWRAQEVVIDRTARHLDLAAENGPGEWQAQLDERLRADPPVDPLTDVRKKA